MTSTGTPVKPIGEIQAMLEALPHPAVVLDRSHRIRAANRLYRREFANGDEVVGQPCYKVAHRVSDPCGSSRGYECPLERCLEGAEPCRAVHVHSTHLGEAYVSILMRPLVDNLGRIESFLETLRSIDLASTRPAWDCLVGRSPAFNKMLEDIERVSSTDTAVLIVGEPGTGKELVARTIHQLSPRKSHPFVPVDCAALTESLFDRELFGHTRHAFPGADESRPGLVGSAKEGTVFLDLVGSLPLFLQGKILRLLETGEYLQEGGDDGVRSDFRLICSTEKDLAAMTAREEFRSDLLLRIATLTIEIPPLRERPEDIPLLVESMLERLACPHRCRDVDEQTLEILRGYAFPGNIRELSTLLERACLLAEGDSILPEHLPADCNQK